MKKETSMFITACLCALTFVLASCEQDGPVETAGKKVDQSLQEAGKKIEKVGDTIQDKVDNAAGSVNDAAITGKVKAAIINDSLLKVLEIEVITSSGIVQLNGTVDTQESIDRAQEVASAVQDVKAVENNLVVKSY